MLNLILPLVLGLLPYHVAAQKATCLSGYSWMFNSLSQSPCDIAAELAGVCVGGGYTISPLDSGYHYPGPATSAATSCRCNTVYYSLIAACSACQDRTYVTWTSYTSNCLSVYTQQYPETIPADTAVPHYAYLDVVTNNNFNLVAAQAASGPESTGVGSPTGYVATRTSTNTRATGTGTSSPGYTSTSYRRKKKTNIAAIAGGAGGGIALLVIAGVVVFLLRRRKTPPPAPTPAYDPMMSQNPSTFGGSPYAASPPLPSSPPTFPSNYPSPAPSAPVGLQPSYPAMYSNQVPTNYTGTSNASFNQGPNPSYNPGSNPSYNQGTNPSYNQGPNPSYNQGPNPSYNPETNPSYNQGQGRPPQYGGMPEL